MTDRNLLTPDAMADRLGWQGEDREASGRRESRRGRRLRLYLLQRESQVGEPLMVRLGSGGPGTRYMLSESLLRMRCPELFGHRLDELQAAFRSHLHAIDDRLDQRMAEHHERVVAPALAALHTRDEDLAEAVSHLRKEHRDHRARLDRIEAQTERWAENTTDLAATLERCAGQ